MPYSFHAYRMTSSRYRASYKHLDTSEYMGFKIKAVFGKARWDIAKDGYIHFDAGYSTTIEMTTSRPVTVKEMRAALHEFDRECGCEHDCCGCYNGGARWRTLRGNRRGTRWTIQTHYSPNV